MKGVDVVVHAASPVNVCVPATGDGRGWEMTVFRSNETSWEDHLNPAVKGAESVLGAAAKDPSKSKFSGRITADLVGVKQVIQCSSFGTAPSRESNARLTTQRQCAIGSFRSSFKMEWYTTKNLGILSRLNKRKTCQRGSRLSRFRV